MKDEPAPRRKGVPAPNFTQVPNSIFELMPDMDQSELRVVLVVCRQTFGWHKQRDRISLSQLVKATGLTKRGVLLGIDKAIDRGILERTEAGKHRNGQTLYDYGLIVTEGDYTSQEIVTSGDHDSHISTPSMVTSGDKQKKERKETKENDRPPAIEFEANTVMAALRHVSKKLDSPMSKKQLNDLAALLLANNRTYEDVKTLWLDCEHADNPIGAFVKAIKENDGLPYGFGPKQSSKGSAAPSMYDPYFLPGTGWIYPTLPNRTG